MFDRYFAEHPIGDVHYAPQFPVMTDRAAWEDVSPADRADLISLAEEYHARPWPMLTAGMYASFVRTGSRRDCENPYFERRRKLCAAALHVCLTGSTDMLPDVEDGLVLISEESVWAISAHAGLSQEHPFPDANGHVVDLFAAQTGMILSFVCQLLESVLHPDLYARARSEVERRVLRPFMEYNDEWWMGYTRKDLNNWTPWILSNILMTANVWHWGGKALIERACMMLDRWLDVVPEDGGCDEGAGYWNMAGGAFLDCLMVLESLCGVDLWQDEKVRRIMAYPALVYLDNGWYANFADCDARPALSGERLQYAGEKTNLDILIRMGSQMRGLPREQLTDTPHLSRVLMQIFSKPAQIKEERRGIKNVWMPSLQVRVMDGFHAMMGYSWRMMTALKGGHNGESHNHNDVGSFVVATSRDGEPLDMQVVDAGNMVYTAKTFSDRRYELWNCRSAYHNVPIIGGCEQGVGSQYAAQDVTPLVGGMSLDMAAAYPAEACVEKYKRTMVQQMAEMIVSDEIVLSEPKPVTWVFMLRHEPVIDARNQECQLPESGFTICWRMPGGLTASVEPIEITDGRMAKSYPGKLWRLMLTAEPADHHTQKFVFEA